MTWTLILSTARRLRRGRATKHLRWRGWTGWSPTWMLGRRITGKRLGIVRHGPHKVRRLCATRARLRVSIHFHNRHAAWPRRSKRPWSDLLGLVDQMLARMDFVSINCPHTRRPITCLSAATPEISSTRGILINTAPAKSSMKTRSPECWSGMNRRCGPRRVRTRPRGFRQIDRPCEDGKGHLVAHMGSHP